MEATEKNVRSNQNQSNMGEFEKTNESRPGLEGTDFAALRNNSVVHLLDLIARIFHKAANINVQKIGLVYLAKVLNFYPDLCARYLEVLLSVEDDVRESVLDIQPENQGEYNIVLSSTSFRYKVAGAPLVWSSVGLAEALDKFVQEQSLEFFEAKHIQILYGCLEQPIDDAKIDTWLAIYKDLQKYIFISLTDHTICGIAASIIKKFFGNRPLCEQILPITKDLFLKIVVNIFEPDIGVVARNNLLELFQYLVGEEGEHFKEYVYQTVKLYSEKHKAAFLKSNLVEFTNDLARSRTKKLFGDRPWETTIQLS